jgi:chemosensory pili system protein ChpA (sensor histidine kinase/response regulator)
MSSSPAELGENELPVSDLGPLAWVLDELRKSLDGATKALRRFVRDADLARGSDLTELDASHLRIARQQLHQAVGALEMVGLGAPAKVLRAMEALAQKFVQRPELCSDDAAAKVEKASFALTEYLEGVLKGKTASSVALFPQYRAVMDLVGSERLHPADLWSPEWRWMSLPEPIGLAAQEYSPAVRSKMDQLVLKIVKSGTSAASQQMVEICGGLALSQIKLEPKTFWTIAAAFFEALSLGLIPQDVYTKRTASRILQQYASLAKGSADVSDRLAQDLAFYCSIAVPAEDKPESGLQSVRRAYGFSRSKTVNYELEQFGRFDPALLTLARKRIASAAETWSALAGGDTNRLKIASEQFSALADSVVKLHPECGDLSKALVRAIEVTVQSGGAPTPAVGMEVATSVLYLEAAYEDLDPTESSMAERSTRLAQRLLRVSAGGEPEPLEAWMEELYRRVSDRQTMGSVVDELRTSLGEVEASLDKFFRSPQDKSPLREVPSQLAQMRGVFSVLGLDQPSLAALRMRASVEQFLVDDIDEASARSGIFDKLGNSLGAMGFLIDMLSYQRALAKKLFVYDEVEGEFKPLMGREKQEVAAIGGSVVQKVSAQSPTFEVKQSLRAEQKSTVGVVANSPLPVVAATSQGASANTTFDDADDETELLDIFLEEAREVIQTGKSAIDALRQDPSNLADQTTLRRAFHTLKGSSRMVGLNTLGEAAWSFEQLMNGWLAEHRPVSDDLMRATTESMNAFERWVTDIGSPAESKWSAAEFRKSSDGLRLENKWIGLTTPAFEAVATSGAVKNAEMFAEAVTTKASISSISPIEIEQTRIDSGEMSQIHVSSDESKAVSTEAVNSAPIPLPTVAEYGASFESSSTLDDATNRAASPAENLGIPTLAAVDFVSTQSGGLNPQFSPTQPPVATGVHVEVTSLEDFGNFDFGVEEPVPVAAQVEDLAIASETLMPEFAVDDKAGEVIGETSAEELVKVIGPLRLSIPLYNVYLNEADEWSRRLQVELSEWALELHEPLPDSLSSLAHSLVGSSATVGFTALSELARALEHALQHVQLHGRGSVAHAVVFNDAAEDIRRLLHQFAAGFLKESDAKVVADLLNIIQTEFPVPTIESEVLVDDPLLEFSSDAVLEFEDSLANPPASNAIDHKTSAANEDLVEVVLTSSTKSIAEDSAKLVPAVAAPLHVADSSDDDIDAIDNLDEDLFPIFEEEGGELMPQLGTALRQWVGTPDNLSARSEVLRILHTLKGSARLAGAMRLGEMTHRMESAIEYIGSEALQSVQLEPLLQRFDNLQTAFVSLGSEPESLQPVATATVEVEQVKTVHQSNTLGNKPLIPFPAASVIAPAKAISNQSVRVRSQLLDRLVNQAGEVMITRSRMDARLTQLKGSLSELGGNLERLRQQLRDVELQAESQMQSRLAQTKDTSQAFDPLEFDRFTRVQELTRMMAESVNDVATVQRNLQRSIEGSEDDLIAQGRQARELQRDLLRTRMVEFEAISDRLYGVVRQASKDAGKVVKLDIVGGSIEMDRGVLDRMTPAFEHMLRNAVAHGIESSEERLHRGKSASGTITIQVHQESNDVSVAFSDDGGGLHLDKIRAKAKANGVIGKNDVISDTDAANLIFMPGFSTADQITELSGRGVGMDVVRAEVSAVGGRIETSTVPAQGTTFKLVLPLTTAVTQVVMLRMGEFTIGVPSNLLEIVLRAPVAALEQAYENHHFDYQGSSLPFFWAGALLQVSGRSHEVKTRTMPVAVLRSAGQRMVLHIDEVLGNREVVVKNLGPQLARLPGLAGVSVLASGAVVLIYNPVALATVYGDQAKQLNRTTLSLTDTPIVGSIAAADAEIPLILVVDDSITVRRVTQRLLKREGYRVALAADGLQALERLQEERPAVVLSDIEMPRMDGFDLARNIRGDARLRDLPIIMITSRIAEKHREHAKELGVDHYLGKPYSEDELLGLVRSYCPVLENS